MHLDGNENIDFDMLASAIDSNGHYEIGNIQLVWSWRARRIGLHGAKSTSSQRRHLECESLMHFSLIAA